MRLGKVHSMNRFDRSIGLAARIVSAMFLLGCAAFAFGQCPSAQQTTVSFTLTDSDSVNWVGAQVDANLYNPSQTQRPLCASTNQTFPIHVTAFANGSGVVSMVLTGSGAITPVGTRWIFTIQSSTSAPPTVTTGALVQTGGSQNLTSVIHPQLIAPRFYTFTFGLNPAIPPATPVVTPNRNAYGIPFGYNIVEVLPTLCVDGNEWLDVTTNVLMICNGGTYAPPTSNLVLQTNEVNNTSQTLLDLANSATVSFANVSGGKVEANVTGGSGVPFNPTTTNYIFASYSGLYDDNHGLSTAVPVTSYSSTGTVVTVETTSAHNLVAGDYIDAHSMTGWPNATQEPLLGSFQVMATGLTSTQFEFDYVGSVSPCSSSCGNTYNANYWAIYQTANQPFIKGHGTVYGFENSISGIDSSFSTTIAPLCAITPGPNYLILEAGQNDLSTGTAAVTMETNFLDVYTQAHAAGCLVIQGSIVAANYGGFPNNNIWANMASINEWFPEQAKSFSTVGTGAYWDQLIDYNAYLVSRNVHLGDDSAAGYIFAQRTNEGVSTKNGSAPGPFPSATEVGSGVGFDVSNTHGPTFWFFYNLGGANNPCGSVDTCNPFMTFGNPGLSLVNNSGNSDPFFSIFDPVQTNYPTFIWGHDSNDAIVQYFHFDSASASTNFGAIVYANGSNFMMKFFEDNHIQFPFLTASSGNQPLQVDTAGNVSVGTTPTTPAWVSATSGLASGFWESEACTVGGVAKTCVEEHISTGALNNASITTVPLIETLTGGILGDPVCSDNSGRVQTGNTQPIGANFAGGTAPFTSFSVWVGATSEDAECIVKGYL